MRTQKQSDQLYELGHEGRVELMNSIDPDAMYFTDYTIDNHGNRINKTGIVKGCDLTEPQMLTAERIPT